jgi:hypothetical protein
MTIARGTQLLPFDVSDQRRPRSHKSPLSARCRDHRRTGTLTRSIILRSILSKQVWNRVPDEVRKRVIDLALCAPELSPRELATRFTDTEKLFCLGNRSIISTGHDLITCPALAADEFRDKTTAPNQLWQTDFPYL